MPSPPRPCFIGLLFLLALGPCAAAPPLPAVSAAAVPDYGGRDAPGLLDGVGTDAPNPAAQAGRSLLALVLVLGGVYGGVTLLKRAGYAGGPVGVALLSGLRRTPPAPARNVAVDMDEDADTDEDRPLALIQSQTLPGGGAVHLLCVHGRTLILVGATAQGVSRITEWEWEDDPPAESKSKHAPRPAFQDYLTSLESSPDRTRVLERIPDGCLSDLLSARQDRLRENTRA